jgi:hypothetical protein
MSDIKLPQKTEFKVSNSQWIADREKAPEKTQMLPFQLFASTFFNE